MDPNPKAFFLHGAQITVALLRPAAPASVLCVMPYLLGAGYGGSLAVSDFGLCPRRFRHLSQESQLAMVCQEEASRDETCDVRANEDEEYGSEPSLISTEM